jgi:hypothetical protein
MSGEGGLSEAQQSRSDLKIPNPGSCRMSRVAVSKGKSAITNRSRLLEGVDGRSAPARRFRDICQSYAAQIGGDASEFEHDAIRQLAALRLHAERLQSAVVLGEPVDSDTLIRINSEIRRLHKQLGLSPAEQRKGSDDPVGELQSYLAQKTSAPA